MIPDQNGKNVRVDQVLDRVIEDDGVWVEDHSGWTPKGRRMLH